MIGQEITVSCVTCGVEFTYECKGGRWRRYCGASCRPKKPRVGTVGVEASCEQCGGMFVRSSVGVRHRFCSNSCRARAGEAKRPPRQVSELQKQRSKELGKAARAREKERKVAQMKADGTYKYCANCGGDMIQSATFCVEPDCRNALRLHRNSQMRDYFARYQAEHGESYTRRYKDRPYNVDYNYRERHPDRAKHYDHVRRARMANCERESFSDSEIFERDGFVCGICDGPVDMGLRYPDAMSASLDHVVPLSRGGGHVRANVRLAHLGCNARKCARLDGEMIVSG